MGREHSTCLGQMLQLMKFAHLFYAISAFLGTLYLGTTVALYVISQGTQQSPYPSSYMVIIYMFAYPQRQPAQSA